MGALGCPALLSVASAATEIGHLEHLEKETECFVYRLQPLIRGSRAGTWRQEMEQRL